MRLYLDDIRECWVGWDLARNYRDAVNMVMAAEMMGEEWTHATLDHDLSFEHYYHFTNQPSSEETGMDFVAWMIEHNKWPTHKPTVHSMNPAGRRRMEQAIERYGPYDTNGVRTHG